MIVISKSPLKDRKIAQLKKEGQKLKKREMGPFCTLNALLCSQEHSGNNSRGFHIKTASNKNYFLKKKAKKLGQFDEKRLNTFI